MELNFPNANHKAVADDVFQFHEPKTIRIYGCDCIGSNRFREKASKANTRHHKLAKRLNIAGLKALAPNEFYSRSRVTSH